MILEKFGNVFDLLEGDELEEDEAQGVEVVVGLVVVAGEPVLEGAGLAVDSGVVLGVVLGDSGAGDAELGDVPLVTHVEDVGGFEVFGEDTVLLVEFPHQVVHPHDEPLHETEAEQLVLIPVVRDDLLQAQRVPHRDKVEG